MQNLEILSAEQTSSSTKASSTVKITGYDKDIYKATLVSLLNQDPKLSHDRYSRSLEYSFLILACCMVVSSYYIECCTIHFLICCQFAFLEARGRSSPGHFDCFQPHQHHNPVTAPPTAVYLYNLQKTTTFKWARITLLVNLHV